MSQQQNPTNAETPRRGEKREERKHFIPFLFSVPLCVESFSL